MKAPTRTLLLAWLSCFAAVTIYAANSKKITHSDKKPEQIVVTVHKADKGLLFEVESGEYKKADANYLLAELKLHNGGDCQIIAVVDDRAPLSAITEISERQSMLASKIFGLSCHGTKLGGWLKFNSVLPSSP